MGGAGDAGGTAPRGASRIRDLGVREPPVGALAQVAELQRAEADALERPDGVPDGLAHAPDLALAALVDAQLEDVRAQPAHVGRGGAPVVELDALAQRPQRAVADRPAATRATYVLRDLEARVREPVGQVAVVGEQDQAGRVGVQAPDRVQPARPTGTRSTTVGRPWVSRAVETTPAGLFSAYTARAAGGRDGPPVDARSPRRP